MSDLSPAVVTYEAIAYLSSEEFFDIDFWCLELFPTELGKRHHVDWAHESITDLGPEEVLKGLGLDTTKIWHIAFKGEIHGHTDEATQEYEEEYNFHGVYSRIVTEEEIKLVKGAKHENNECEQN